MGQVLVKIRIVPQEMEKFDQLKADVEESLKPYKVEEQPLAFGIVAIVASFVVEDKAGGTDLLEERAASLPNVSSVEILSADRI
ncbi:MAG: hypothetical protein N3G80_00145 [Candidatus Micrarchaeota archaeon]|nr:hypothetical protein [Candidatus Micrarchaeota archaeon]